MKKCKCGTYLFISVDRNENGEFNVKCENCGTVLKENATPLEIDYAFDMMKGRQIVSHIFSYFPPVNFVKEFIKYYT